MMMDLTMDILMKTMRKMKIKSKKILNSPNLIMKILKINK